MPKVPNGLFANWQYDLPASLVVFLVALPLCLGIALASGAPLFSGLIAGVVGGIVVGAVSKSPLSVSGPAAGLTVIVFAAIQQLPSFEAFLLAVMLAGAMQIALGAARAGVLGDFIPNSVITGMLAAIGLILILKQFPHALGYDADTFGGETLLAGDAARWFASLKDMVATILPGAAFIAITSLVFLFWWDKKQPKLTGVWRYLPGPLVVVAYGVAANAVFALYLPGWELQESHLVAVPVAASLEGFLGQFMMPDFSQISNGAVWSVAITLALVASIESLLSIEAIDKLDPYKRVTPTNRELLAQGAGNLVSGLVGGLPVTSVIVRSTANVSSGARSKLSTMAHGVLLLGCVVAIPALLNLIPLSALAAVLISVGYKLTKPALYVKKYKKGPSHFYPFVITVAAILLTDLLVGIGIGVVVGVAFMLIQSFRSAATITQDGTRVLIAFHKDLFFIHKYELKRMLSLLANGSEVTLDFSRITYIDKDNIEILNDFAESAKYRKISLQLRGQPEGLEMSELSGALKLAL